MRSIRRNAHLIDHEQIQALIAHKAIKAVTLTGSKRAGIAVASAAAQVVKPCVLELGGSDPFIVFADANIDEAVKVAVTSRCLNNGQSCIAAKRFIVEHSVFERFVSAMTEQMKTRVIGPLANLQQQQLLKDQVQDAIAKGAKTHCGGAITTTKGYFYPPTVLSQINPSMRVSHEEVFGPVATLWSFKTDDEALQLANNTDFGLAATLFTTSAERIARFTDELESGQVFVNDLVRSDQRVPFGGIKESGYGRELGPRASLSFTNEKTVWVKSTS
jgi:acyl-CoA reductase-like NAD-dependent aldehyde dehydrogenase